jgi:hypothetical protein
VTSAQLTVVETSAQAWRVGFQPEPWAWSGWEWAGADGRFHGRWDDREGRFRTVYAGSSLLACLLEVLAGFRPDAALVLALEGIVEDEEDATLHPTTTAGEVPYAWLEPRSGATATLTGRFCAVTTFESIATLRPQFIAQAHLLELHDFDASALKDGRPRDLTQSVATFLHATTDLAGVTFQSRHGDDLMLWAIFERGGDPSISPNLAEVQDHALSPEHPDLVEAFRLLGLTWEQRPMTAAMPEAGRQAAHILLDTVIAFDAELGGDPLNSDAMNLALQRLNDVNAVTARFDTETYVLDSDVSPLAGGSAVTMMFLARQLALVLEISVEEVVANTRKFLDEPLPPE